jgi:hypothetical protein
VTAHAIPERVASEPRPVASRLVNGPSYVPVLVGEVSRRVSSPRPARPRAPPPGTAIRTWQAFSERRPSQPAGPTAFSWPATDASPYAVANNVPWSPSVDPILVIIWHLLADPDIRYKDLGADHYTRHVDLDAKRRNHIR